MWSHTMRICYRSHLWGRLIGPPSSLSSVPRRFLQTDSSLLLHVALMGPPNAGKSTLFNRLLDKQANKAYKLSSDKKKRNRNRKTQHNNNNKITGRLKASLTRRTTSGPAIVSAIPGTTRDRRDCMGRIGSTSFVVMDTAGVDGERLLDHASPLTQAMMNSALQAVRQAELVFLMMDARSGGGMTADLTETVRWLRKVSSDATVLGQRKIVLLANKLEGEAWNHEGSDVWDHLEQVTRLGFGEAIPISALHGEGMADLAVIIQELSNEKRRLLGMQAPASADDNNSNNNDDSTVDKPLQLAILGRVNVGKSTLVNALLQQNRVITGEMPGLTRDAIAIDWTWNNMPVQLVDTAGIRKRAQRLDDVEDMAVQDALRAMKVADVAVLVIDAGAKMLQRQELAIADAVLKEGRALVIAANKMDLIVEQDYDKDKLASDVRAQLEARFPMLRQTPIVPMSSLRGEYVEDLMPVVFTARDRWARVIPTGQLNRWLQEVLHERPPPQVSGKYVRIKYIMQTKGRPPTFLLFCNAGELPESYLRFLTRHFQDSFQMFGMEVRLAVKKSAKSNPYGQGRKRTGSGLGGREARQQRIVKELKKSGQPKPQRKKKRRKA